MKIAETLAALGVLAYSREEDAKAEAYNQRRLDSLRRLPPGNEVEISNALNDLSMSVQQARADYATAKRFAEEALALRRKAIQGPHLSISQGLNNLGMVHYRMKEYDVAEVLFKESLAINRQLFGEPHPEIVANLSNLGLLSRDRGDYRQADALFAQVVAADWQILGQITCWRAAHHYWLSPVLMKRRTRTEPRACCASRSLFMRPHCQRGIGRPR